MGAVFVASFFTTGRGLVYVVEVDVITGQGVQGRGSDGGSVLTESALDEHRRRTTTGMRGATGTCQ